MENRSGGVVSHALAETADRLSPYVEDVSAGSLDSLSDADLLAEVRECEALVGG